MANFMLCRELLELSELTVSRKKYTSEIFLNNVVRQGVAVVSRLFSQQ
jgi:hypothetical protein